MNYFAESFHSFLLEAFIRLRNFFVTLKLIKPEDCVFFLTDNLWNTFERVETELQVELN